MLAILLAVGLANLEPRHFEPTDDFWIYPFASDTAEPYLRAWGSGGRSVPEGTDDPEAYSHSYLRFDLTEVPKGEYTVKSASFVVYHVPGFAFTRQDAAKSPLELRFTNSKFREKTWDHGFLKDLKPKAGAAGVVGSGELGAPDGDKPVAIAFDLLKGKDPFADRLVQVLNSDDRTLGFLLTAAFDPSTSGRDYIYKVFSKDGPAEFRPKLTLDLVAAE